MNQEIKERIFMWLGYTMLRTPVNNSPKESSHGIRKEREKENMEENSF